MRNVFSFHHGNPKRWIGLLLAVVSLHMAAIAWMTGQELSFKRQTEQDGIGNPITVSLQAAQQSKASPPLPAPEPETGAAEKISETPAEPAAAPKPPAASDAASARQDVSATASAAPDARAEAPMQAEQQAEDGAEPWTAWQASPPPSARLAYRIQALRQGQSVFGNGQIGWRNNGSSYSVEGESNLLLFTVFNFRSEGTVDARHGIAPVMYSEKRFRKSGTNTHFHRERNQVSFSASTRTYPRRGGEQDRSSVVWQLSGIGRHESRQFRPGVQFAIFVAGARDAETWHFNVVGLEEVDTALGKMKTWHLERKPRPGSYDQRVNIWLAPDREWYPVRLRHTDRSGEYLEMTVTEIKAAAP